MNVEQRADEILRTPPDSPAVKGRRWQARIMKSLVLNFRGYLDRQQGRYLEAVRHYQQSAMLQRRLGMSALVPTLTNLSFAMALTGDFHHARLMSEEAARLARRGGKEHMLAMTLNVRALVEAYDDHHKAALRYTDRALEIADDLPTFRARGLIYLTRARAHRYLWHSLSEGERQREPGYFDEMLKEANQAVNLLRSTPADRVEALLERGCIYRELARLNHAQKRTEEAEEFVEKSRKDLERATVLSGVIALPRQQALAWTNLGWLYYYVDRLDDVLGVLEKTYESVPKEYLFPAEGPLPSMAQEGRQREATLPFWSTLGKTEMLKAYLSLDQALIASEKEEYNTQLGIAVEHITLSLAYNELIADAYFDLMRAEEGLHRRILHDGLKIGILHQYAQQIAEERGLKQPTRLQGFLDRMFGPADLWA